MFLVDAVAIFLLQRNSVTQFARFFFSSEICNNNRAKILQCEFATSARDDHKNEAQNGRQQERDVMKITTKPALPSVEPPPPPRP